MILVNPTDNDITVKIEGIEYTAPANGGVELPEAHAKYWKERLHSFMELAEDAPKEKKIDAPVEEKVEEVAEVVEEKEEVAEEKKEEKKSAKKTNKK
jgi:hypothetical protein